MNAPRRWRDSLDAPEELRRIFAAGTPTHALPDAARDRIAGRLANGAPPLPSAGYSLAWKGVAIGAILSGALVGAGVAAMRVARPAVGPRGVEAPAALVSPVEPQLPLQAKAVDPPGAVPARCPRARRRPPSPILSPMTGFSVRPRVSVAEDSPAPRKDTLLAELTLLERARASLDRDPASTLAVLGDHARLFPAGKLAVERELMALDALQRLGRTASERERAQRLLAVVSGTIGCRLA